MKNLTWQNPEQLFVAQELINKVKSKCCGIKDINASHRINRYLKAIGKELGLSVPLTQYDARHSWASAARSKNIPISVISESMGHDSENTTRIYLTTLDTATIDKANRLILNSLCRE